MLGEETGFWRWLEASSEKYEVDCRLQEGELIEEPLGTLHTGHGEDVLDHRAAIAARLDAAERRCARIEDLLGDAPLTAFEVASRLWSPERVEWDPTIAVSDVVGHLDVLVERRAVEIVEDRALQRFLRTA